MANFDHAYEVWRVMPFPAGSSTDSVDELHAALALVDSWVAEALVPLVEHGAHRPIQVDPLSKLEEIKDRATRLAPDLSGPDKLLLDQYIRYADAVREAYEAFLRTAPPS